MGDGTLINWRGLTREFLQPSTCNFLNDIGPSTPAIRFTFSHFDIERSCKDCNDAKSGNSTSSLQLCILNSFNFFICDKLEILLNPKKSWIHSWSSFLGRDGNSTSYVQWCRWSLFNRGILLKLGGKKETLYDFRYRIYNDENFSIFCGRRHPPDFRTFNEVSLEKLGGSKL